jgi:xanthine dehydrogenase accessory factor
MTHPLPDNLPRTLVEWIDAGRRFALVTVLRDAGSTPRKAGTKALIDAEGNLWGTVGGGLLESDTRRMAVEAIASGRPTAFDFRFSGACAAGDDPVCGGTMRLLIDPAPAKHRHAFAESASDLAARRRGVLATTSYEYVNDVIVAWLREKMTPLVATPATDRAVQDAWAREAPQYFHGVLPDVDPQHALEGLAELLVPPPLLLVAGGGHVGRALARQASLLDFEVVVTDDRAEFTDSSLYLQSVKVHRGRFAELVSQWPLNRDTYVAIVGRGHKVDGDALVAVIKSDAGYVGMMGSRRKVALIRKEFLESGMATAEQFDRVHAPIGLDIGAQTVEEIAASIVAELVAVRRGKRPPRGR